MRARTIEMIMQGTHPFSFNLTLSRSTTSFVASSDGSMGHHLMACWVTPPRACHRCLVSSTLTEATSFIRLTDTVMRARSLLPKPITPKDAIGPFCDRGDIQPACLDHSLFFVSRSRWIGPSWSQARHPRRCHRSTQNIARGFRSEWRTRQRRARRTTMAIRKYRHDAHCSFLLTAIPLS